MRSTRGSAQTLLSGVPLFARLDDRHAKRVAKGARKIEAPRGRVLFAPGDACDGMYAIISGRIKLALPMPGHPEKVIALPGPGATFGETGMFLDEPQMMSAETLLDTTLVHVLTGSVLDAMQREPAFARHMLAALSRRVRELISDMRCSAADSGTQRTVTFLLGQVANAAVDGTASITLPAKKRVIASRLNLTGEHFSRILRELSSASLIRVEGPRVTIPDVRKLRARCAAATEIERG